MALRCPWRKRSFIQYRCHSSHYLTKRPIWLFRKIYEWWNETPSNVIIEEAKKLNYKLTPEVYNDEAQNLFNEDNLNYAVIGHSGSGKSTFINSFFGKKDGDKDAAKVGICETTGVEAPIRAFYLDDENAKDSGDCKVMFWDLPGWGSLKYSVEEYEKNLCLPLFRGIIIITASRFSESDVKFFKLMRETEFYLLKKNANFTKHNHVPVYLVRTKFDHDLDSRLKTKLIELQKKRWFKKLFPKENLKHSEFMEVYDDTIKKLRDEVTKQFADICDSNALKYCFFIVSGDWQNRMLTTDRNDINNGFVGFQRRIASDIVLFDPDLDYYERRDKEMQIDQKLLDKLRDDIHTPDSELYKRHCSREKRRWFR